MQDRKQLETYCKNSRWDDADTWVCKELVFLHTRVVRRRICSFAFAILMTLVLSGITWGGIFPGCNGVEITKFPFAKAADAFFVWMRPMIPIEGGGGNAVAILGLLLLPFVVWGLLSLFTCLIRSKKYAKKKGVTVNDSDVVKKKIGLLDKMYSKHNHGYEEIMFSFIFGSAIVGCIMAVCACTSPEKFGRYLFVGLVCAALYVAVFWGAGWVVSRIYEAKEAPIFNPYNYYDYIDMANGEYVYYGSDDDTPPTTSSFDDETIKTILDDVFDDLSGGGFGDY